jgi:hypothetical protein
MKASQRGSQTTVGRQKKRESRHDGEQAIRKQKAGMLENTALEEITGRQESKNRQACKGGITRQAVNIMESGRKAKFMDRQKQAGKRRHICRRR